MARRRTCFLCGVALGDGERAKRHLKTLGHRRRERRFKRAFGAELVRKLERLIVRASGAKGSARRRRSP